MSYEFTPEMGEISGFGGGYEQACRAMLKAGLGWLDAHPGADPKFHGYSGIYGLITEDNQDAKDLTAAVLAPAGGDATGAMHQAVIETILYVRRNGWAKYVEVMSKPRGEEQ